ncbi:MAG: hypothetical protein HRU03_09510 [Nanoarchaeales archaeon]|nr:hypothetical protein [Nanoarchaeales archaeon]
MRKISKIYDIAINRKGGDSSEIFGDLELKSDNQLKKISDDRYLSEITKRIFQNGFSRNLLRRISKPL